MAKKLGIAEIQKMLKLNKPLEARVQQYLEENSQQLKASFYLAKMNPNRYRLEKASNMEGMEYHCRLIDLKTNEVISNWQTYSYLHYNFETLLQELLNEQIKEDTDAEIK